MPGRMVAGAWLSRVLGGSVERKLAMEDITIFESFASEHSCGHSYPVGSPQRTATHSGTYMRYVH